MINVRVLIAADRPVPLQPLRAPLTPIRGSRLRSDMNAR
jgi:hypothetical protein